MHRLITLSFSHYNEKARWALDRFAVPYEEERHMPFFCSVAVAVATRGRGGAADRSSSRYSTPVLLVDDGQVLTDSTLEPHRGQSRQGDGPRPRGARHDRG